MKRLKLIILLALLNSSCFVGNTYGQTGGMNIRPNINALVVKLRKADEVHFGYAVGFAGIPETNNQFYQLYLQLRSGATNEELVLLAKDSIKSIVIYSFSILLSRNYEKLTDIFIEHLNDTSFYWTAGGCTGILDRVNWFMLRSLDPANKRHEKKYLTKEAFDLYCTTFKKQDAHFSCH